MVRAFPAIVACLGCVATSHGQIVSPPGLCFGFNDNLSSPIQSLPLVAGGELWLGFTAPVAAAVERIEIYSAGFPASPAVSVSVEVRPDIGGMPGPLLGGGVSSGPLTGWIQLILAAPVSFTAGGAYALRLTISAGSLSVNGDQNQPVPIAYVLGCGTSPPPLFPPCSSLATSGTFGARLRFRALACGPTPLASATPSGVPCGGGFAGLPSLSTNAAPVLGSLFPLFVTSGLGGFIQIFWAAGPATPGVDLGIGGGCAAYLDLVSARALYAAGLQPLAAFPNTGITTSTTFNIPLNPALAGITVTTQALIVGPSGIPTSIGSVQISNALELELGY